MDGGLADNFPISIFDSEKQNHTEARSAGCSIHFPPLMLTTLRQKDMKTLGFFLQEDKTKQSVTREIATMKDFMGCLLDTVKQRIAYLSVCEQTKGGILNEIVKTRG